MTRSMKIIAFALPGLVFVAGVVSAQRAATQKRGVSSAVSSFASGDLDSISLFSGALSMGLDLGLTYPTGQEFSYQFQAFVNSSFWDFESTVCTEGAYSLPVPDPRYNLGHSAMLHFGRVTWAGSHYKFLGSDGAEHGLYPRLHAAFPAIVDPNVYFSTSSTYIRMRRYPTGGAECQSEGAAGSECLVLDFAGGISHEFRPRTVAGEVVYLPTRLAGSFSGEVNITYPSEGISWVISDTHGRSHEVVFAGTPGDYKRITEIRLAKFGGGQATYKFQYTNRNLERQGFAPHLCSSESSTVPVVALSRIVFPGGEYYEFDYYETDDSGAVLSGGVKSLRTRTGGEIRYEYTPLIISSQVVDPSPPSPGPELPPIQKAYGVAKKELALSAGGAAVSTWTYSYLADFSVTVPGEDGVPCARSTTVTDPLGHQSVHYFTTSSRHRWSYSLPFTRCAGGTYEDSAPFLSSEVYSGTVATGTKLRSTFVTYESDGLLVGNGAQTQEHNQRLIYSETVYHADGGKKRTTAHSDFDGLGNFRTTAVGGTFSAQDSATTTTRFNPGRGSLVVNPESGSTVGSTFVMPSTTERWDFSTYDLKKVTAAGATTSSEFCFGDDGFLERSRVLAGASRAARDLLYVYEPEKTGGVSTGFVATELVYGGDDQTAMDGDYDSLCDMTLPSQPKYQKEHTYSAGVRATSTAVDPCDGGAVLSLADQTIDSHTGLVASSRTAAGVQTEFDYDEIGRLVTEQPEESAWVSYAYQLPTQASPTLVARLTVSQCPNGSSTCTTGAALAWARLELDGLGRQKEEMIRLPAVTGLKVEARKTTYNAAGHKASISAWGDDTLVTTYSDYDPFGRPGKITPQGQHTTEIAYLGDRVRTVKTQVQASGGAQDAFTTEIFDAQGRLVSVCEGQATAWAGTCTGVVTSYLYDVGSRITRVCMNQQGSACGQIRRFLYDGRGFMTQERHPEVGVNGNGWAYYTHDAKGQVLTKVLQGSTEFDVNYHYDVVGRLIRVEETNGGSPRPLKELFYARANSGIDRRAGQLVQARRHNWVDIISPLPAGNSGSLDGVITETFKYEGRDGRVSAGQTRFTFNGETYAFDFSQTYDQLGNVHSLAYPQCRHSQGDCPTAAPARTVTSTYSKGFLRSVSGVASELSYQAGGMLHEVEHTNGVTYTLEIDSTTGLGRPHRITAQRGATVLWDTGIHSYDGAGNLSQIGTQAFRYDRRGRMTRGQTRVGTQLRTQSALYDNYGNLTSLTTQGSTQALAVDGTSNRLTALSAKYDGAGNLSEIDYGSERYEYGYDATNMLKHLRSNKDLARIYLYNASDERIAQFQCIAGVCNGSEALEIWTLRGFDNKVLRTYHHPWGEGWQWKDDYVYGHGQLLAQITPQATLHLHSDHLGTPRSVTNASGNQVALHNYYPFGAEATNASQSSADLKYTGHERDKLGTKGQLDYMHARYCSPVLGRFSSVDPARSQDPADPQTWNRYTYGRNNPIKYVDPDGEVIETGWDAFNVGLGIGSLIANVSAGNGSDALLDTAGLLGDLAAAAIPGVPGGLSSALKLKRATQLARNAKIGRVFEQSVRRALGATKNTKGLTQISNRVTTIPDLLGKRFGVVDIKNVKSVSLTKQLRAQVAAAQTAAQPFSLIISPRTKTISLPLQRKIRQLGGKIFIFDPNTGKFAEAAITKNRVTGAVRPST